MIYLARLFEMVLQTSISFRTIYYISFIYKIYFQPL